MTTELEQALEIKAFLAGIDKDDNTEEILALLIPPVETLIEMVIAR